MFHCKILPAHFISVLGFLYRRFFFDNSRNLQILLSILLLENVREYICFSIARSWCIILSCYDIMAILNPPYSVTWKVLLTNPKCHIFRQEWFGSVWWELYFLLSCKHKVFCFNRIGAKSTSNEPPRRELDTPSYLS